MHAPTPDQDGYTTYSRDELHIDLAFLARNRDSAYTPLKSGRGDWPVDSFSQDVCGVGGVRARVVSATDRCQAEEPPQGALHSASVGGGPRIRPALPVRSRGRTP